jgi:basic membrane lipoprotein Med (substrate-binding protein (PBP1-ABC) superfamily)
MKEKPLRGVMKNLAVVSVLALALAACGGGDSKDSGSGSSASTSSGKALKVGMAFDVGGRGDGTFNDLAVAGLEKAKSDLGAEIQELSPKVSTRSSGSASATASRWTPSPRSTRTCPSSGSTAGRPS